MADAPGPLVVDFAGTGLDAEDRELLRHPLVGGIILFTRNYENPSQLVSLCADLHGLRPDCPLLVTVDHEGGRVQRFRDGFTQLPPASGYGERHAREPREACAAAREHGRNLAAELLAVGVDLVFAPVLDIGRGLGSVIGDRALAADPDAVSALGREWIAGMHDAGMAACAKHFPGHGGVGADSHHEVPVDARPLADIEAADLVPFRAAVAAGVDMVMMAHVVYPEVDSLPASLSRTWVHDILRDRLGFEGVVVCDDLAMAGAAGCGTFEERARLALEAGCELLPVCNDRAGVVEIIDADPRVTSMHRVAGLRPGVR